MLGSKVKLPTKPAPKAKVGKGKDKSHPTPMGLFTDLGGKEKEKEGEGRAKKETGVRKRSVLQERASWNSEEDAFVSVITGLWC